MLAQSWRRDLGKDTCACEQGGSFIAYRDLKRDQVLSAVPDRQAQCPASPSEPFDLTKPGQTGDSAVAHNVGFERVGDQGAD